MDNRNTQTPTAGVYVVEADNGEVKVGVSGTPSARLSQIKRAYGPRRGFRDARLLAIVWTHFAMQVESGAIERLLPHATGGEWFRCDPQDAVQAVIREAEAWSTHPGVDLDPHRPPVRRSLLRAGARAGN